MLQQLAKIYVSEVLVALSCMSVSETARNLGIIVNSQLTLSAQVAAMYLSAYYQLWHLQLLVISVI